MRSGCGPWLKNFRNVVLDGILKRTQVIMYVPQFLDLSNESFLAYHNIYIPTHLLLWQLQRDASHLTSFLKLVCPALINLLGLSIVSRERQGLLIWSLGLSVLEKDQTSSESFSQYRVSLDY